MGRPGAAPSTRSSSAARAGGTPGASIGTGGEAGGSPATASTSAAASARTSSAWDLPAPAPTPPRSDAPSSPTRIRSAPTAPWAKGWPSPGSTAWSAARPAAASHPTRTARSAGSRPEASSSARSVVPGR